jgi:hypothetical protein
MGAGKRPEWLVVAIGDAAADTPGGETQQARQRRVRAYCDRARAPNVDGSAGGRLPKGPAVQGGPAQSAAYDAMNAKRNRWEALGKQLGVSEKEMDDEWVKANGSKGLDDLIAKFEERIRQRDQQQQQKGGTP